MPQSCMYILEQYARNKVLRLSFLSLHELKLEMNSGHLFDSPSGEWVIIVKWVPTKCMKTDTNVNLHATSNACIRVLHDIKAKNHCGLYMIKYCLGCPAANRVKLSCSMKVFTLVKVHENLKGFCLCPNYFFR